jgi:hypothetical protein
MIYYFVIWVVIAYICFDSRHDQIAEKNRRREFGDDEKDEI